MSTAATPETETTTSQIPWRIEDIDVCHIIPWPGHDAKFYKCGAPRPEKFWGGPGNHRNDGGKAICECGRPVCPRCAQLIDLERRLQP